MGPNNFCIHGKRKEIKKPPETDIYIDDHQKQIFILMKGLDKY